MYTDVFADYTSKIMQFPSQIFFCNTMSDAIFSKARWRTPMKNTYLIWILASSNKIKLWYFLFFVSSISLFCHQRRATKWYTRIPLMQKAEENLVWKYLNMTIQKSYTFTQIRWKWMMYITNLKMYIWKRHISR